MRLVSFTAGQSRPRLGAVLGPWNDWEWIVDLNAADSRLPGDMLAFVDACGSLSGPVWRLAKRVVAGAVRDVQRGSRAHAFRPQAVRIRAPIAPRLLRDFMGFRAHIVRTRAVAGARISPEWDRLPGYFNGNHLNVVGPGDSVPRPRFVIYEGRSRKLVPTMKLDYEAEIGFVLGRAGRNLRAKDARRCLFGVTIFNDFSARDVQATSMAVGAGPAAGKDWTNALGPCIVTRDTFGPLRDQTITVRVNGRERLGGTYRELVFENREIARGQRAAWTFEEMVEFASHCQGVRAGEVWGSGTIPGGCELERGDEARYLRRGDRVEIEVEGIGTLSNRIGGAS